MSESVSAVSVSVHQRVIPQIQSVVKISGFNEIFWSYHVTEVFKLKSVLVFIHSRFKIKEDIKPEWRVIIFEDVLYICRSYIFATDYFRCRNGNSLNPFLPSLSNILLCWKI